MSSRLGFLNGCGELYTYTRGCRLGGPFYGMTGMPSACGKMKRWYFWLTIRKWSGCIIYVRRHKLITIAE